MGVRFDVLGPLRLHHGDDVRAVPGSLRRILLAMLLASANEPVRPELLVDTLWGERADESAMRRLHLQVHRLRGTLDDPERLTTDATGYRLRVGPGELDADRFGALVTEAEGHSAHDPRRAAELLREAQCLWRGTPYQGADVPELAGEILRLAERRLAALEALYTAELGCGRHVVIIGELADLVRQHPLRERLHALRMTALYRSGRQADALAAFRDARATLADELGLDPGPELRDLERKILAGAPVGLPTPAAPRARPAQLPHNVPGFVGRAAELSELDKLLAGGGESVLISAVAGSAGVGKTSLAVRWAHQVKDRFPDGQLYVDLRGYGPDRPVSPDDVLAAFLRALGLDGAAIPPDPAERAARFRTLVDGKRLLILLDNARSADQVRPLLAGTPTCFVVVTSRDSLAGLVAREGAHRISLDRMTAKDADHLLGELLGNRRDAEEATAQLVERCARLPLALRIAAERLRERPYHRVADLVAELADEQARLDLLDSGDRQTSVRAVFAASYRHLDPAAARLFRLFGVSPGHDVDADALAALAGDDLRTTRRLLDTLVRANLVEEIADSRYAMHDLLWTYAAELAETTEPWAERRSAMARLLDYYLHTATRAAGHVFPLDAEYSESSGTTGPVIADYDAAIRWLDAERVNLLRTAEAAPAWDLPTYVTELASMLFGYLDVVGYLDEATPLYTRALAIARERGDPVAEATALRGIAIVHFRRQRYLEAAGDLEHALTLFRYGEARGAQAMTLNCLGVVYGFMGRADDAVSHLRQAIDLDREIGHHDMLMRALTSLGLLHRRRGEHEQALRRLHEALAIAEEGSHPVGQSHAAYGLAGLYRDTERHADALEFARKAVRLSRQARFRFLEGLALHRTGTIHMRLGDLDGAQRCHGDALAIARSTGNTQLEAMALNGSAEAHAAAGAPATAAQCHRDALAVAADRGADFEQARALDGLGDVYECLGEQDRAVEHWRQALDRFGVLDVSEAATVRAKLARVG